MGKLLMVSLIVFSQLFGQELKENDPSDNGWSIYGGMQSMDGGEVDVRGFDVRGFSNKTAIEFGVIKAVSEKIDLGLGLSERGWSETNFDRDDIDWSASAIELCATYDLFNLKNDWSFWIGSSYAILSTMEQGYQADEDGNVHIDFDNEFDIDNDFSMMFGITLPAGSDGNSFKVGYQTSLGEVDFQGDEAYYLELQPVKFSKLFVNFTYRL